MDNISLSKEDHPELADALAGKQPGQRCRLIIDVDVVENSDMIFSADVAEVEVDKSYADEDPEETEEEFEDEEAPGDAVVLMMSGEPGM